MRTMMAVLRLSLLAATFLLIALPWVCLVSSFCFAAVFTKKVIVIDSCTSTCSTIVSKAYSKAKNNYFGSSRLRQCGCFDLATSHHMGRIRGFILHPQKAQTKPFATTSFSSLNNLSNNNHDTDGKLLLF
jgi:hypothetical protein